jgi:glycosyltransferase involved in cell wall biosynthesis
MRFAVYSPYLDTASGGEKYILTIAELLQTLGEVEVLLDNHLWTIGAEKIKKLNESRHNLDLKNIRFIKAPVGAGSKVFERNNFLKKYDLLFYLSDGSIFYSTSKKSYVHIQMPLDHIQAKGVLNKIKWSSWRKIIYNSKFTKTEIEKKITKPGIVLYPPVNTSRFKGGARDKKNIILNVGRFVGDGVKKQHILIEVFRKLSEENLKGWQLHLAGALKDSDKKYFDELVGISSGLDIIFHPNIEYSDLTKLYLQSKIYWHSMGYGEQDPKKMEHFGITTVEAMAAGAVPVVVDCGGQVEVVEDGVNGMVWGDMDELKIKTLKIINSKELMSKLSHQAQLKSQIFSEEIFKEKILKLINE